MTINQDFKTIIKNTDMNDPEELRDVIAMLSRQKTRFCQQQAKRLKAQLKKIKAAQS